MNQRYLATIATALPPVDLVDCETALRSPKRAHEQFAPDCSQQAYHEMATTQDLCVDDYVIISRIISYQQRE